MILHILVLVTSCLLTINAANEKPLATQRLLPKDSKFDISDWELCKAVGLQSREDANVIISPVSLKVVLAVLLDASKGNTAKEIADFLQFTNGTDENEKVKIRNTYSMLLHSLQKQTPSLTSAVATRIFAHNTVTLNNTFLKVLKDYYSTEVDKVNLNEVASVVKKINKWADITTSGHVKDLLQESDVKKDAVMILMNVIFFNGLWEQPFEENQTKVEQFHLNNTHSTTVKMMKSVQQLQYAQVFDYKMQLLRLPYLDTSFAMYIVLPSVKDGLDDLIENVTPGRVQALMSTLQLSKVNVTIPRFDFSYNIHLKGILENLGVRTMFENADFSNLATGPSSGLRVSNILQKAGIEVNEKGSAAYAATVVEIDNRVKEDEPIFEFNANRPFLFFIEDDKTRNVMFVGKVGNPKAETPPAFSTNPIQPPKPVIQGTSKPKTN